MHGKVSALFSFTRVRNSFTIGSGTGSQLSSNTIKAGLAGAAAGFVVHKGGKMFLRSGSAGMGYIPYGGHNYYYGDFYRRVLVIILNFELKIF